MRRHYSLLLVALVALAVFAQGGVPNHIPAHHNGPPKTGEKLPPILPKSELWGPDFRYPVQVHAYELASRIPNVIYQQPCYCYCEREGHTSLHSCYETTHATMCAACMQELYYSYVQTKKGKTPAQVREGIVRGEWEKVDLNTAASIN